MAIFGQFPINLIPVELTTASRAAALDSNPMSPDHETFSPNESVGPQHHILKIELGYAGISPDNSAGQWMTGRPLPHLGTKIAEFVAPLFVHIDLEFWRDVFSARVPEEVIADLKQQGRRVQYIEESFDGLALDPYSGYVYAPVSFDYYGILIRSLPRKGYANAKELLDVLRMEFGDILERTNSRFVPDDVTRWINSPLGSVLHIDFYTEVFRNQLGGMINFDSGAVVVSAVDDTSWTVHTIYDPHDMAHPLAGVRRWGFTENPDGSVLFYTKAIDRPWRLIDYALSSLVFQGADSLWRAFQWHVADFVNKKGGDAQILPPIRNSFDWSRVAAFFDQPR